jgi:hypothetical protein
MYDADLTRSKNFNREQWRKGVLFLGILAQCPPRKTPLLFFSLLKTHLPC